jgi:hypothetical protein
VAVGDDRARRRQAAGLCGDLDGAACEQFKGEIRSLAAQIAGAKKMIACAATRRTRARPFAKPGFWRVLCGTLPRQERQHLQGQSERCPRGASLTAHGRQLG